MLFGASIARPEAYTLRKTGPFPPAVVTEKGGEPAIRPDRIADAWELAAPQRDRLDPEKLQKILAAGSYNMTKPPSLLCGPLQPGRPPPLRRRPPLAHQR